MTKELFLFPITSIITHAGHDVDNILVGFPRAQLCLGSRIHQH